MEGDVTHPTKLFILLTIATLSTFFRPSAAASSASTEDAAVMAKLAKSLVPTPPDWQAPDPCDWTGITCDASGHVTSISLASKSLGGQMPPELNKLSNLKTLSVQRNHLSGPFPSLTDLANLQTVNLDNNNFTSVPSPFLAGLTSLQSLSIGENPNLPPWTLPETLANSSTLSNLDAEQSNLFGTIPDIFGSFPNLQNLRLSYNNLSGILPPSFANTGIQNLWLNSQAVGLSGKIDVLGTMSQLTQVWLHQNQFSGPIPDLSGATALFDLSLRDNLLTGPLPPSLMTLPKLVNVSLQNNMFQGPSPRFPNNVIVTLGKTNSFCNPTPSPCDPQVTILLEIAGAFGYPMPLAESWAGNNPCQGWKSVSCDLKGSVTVLNFGKEGLVGRISPAIANLTALTTLLLNDNNLTGTIPPSLVKLGQLRVVDLSNNNISGQVPEFGSAVKLDTSGNPLIGKDVPVADSSNGSSVGTTSTVGGTTTTSSSTSPWVTVATIVAAVIVVFILSLVIYKRLVNNRAGKYKWVKASKKGTGMWNKGGANGYGGFGSDLPSQGSVDNSDMQVYDGGNSDIPVEVLREATSNFSEDRILGQGGFGIVYRGQLPDGTEIAVKRMEGTVASSKGLSEFEAEIAVLSKVRHRHLVALHGFCVNGNERLLVYEYMPQGTLAQHLFCPKQMGLFPLAWKQRVIIVLDVARGIEYLHSLAQQSFIHRDLKPSNILLGDDMRAKVSDFGLVKNAPDGNYSVETKLAGTFGYLAPEYASTGKVTTKVDVFAFGVVLMEIITGRKALDGTLPDEESHLVTWFRRLLNNKDSIRKHLDPSLEPDEETFDSICRVAELAGHCTAREPFQRPDMGHTVNVLSPLVEQWKPAAAHGEEDGFGFDLHMSLPQAVQKWKSDEDSSSSMTSDLYKGYSSSSTAGGPSSSFSSRGVR